MLIAITILFLMYHVVTLFKGSPLYNVSVEMGEEKIRKYKEGADNFKENKEVAYKAGLLVLFFSLPLQLAQFTYICTMVKNDVYVFPTATLLGYYVCILLFAILKKKKDVMFNSDRDIEKFRKKINKKLTGRYIFNKIIYISYFTYMLTVLVFLVK